MTDKSRYSLYDAFVLHSRSYKESSLIIDLFTREFGRITVVAKGVKKKKRSTFGLLQPFTPILVSWVGKGELYTLTNVEINGIFKYLYGTNLLCGYYLNELLLRFLEKQDPFELLYKAYSEVINSLKVTNEIEPMLRQFECILFNEIGYGLNFTIENLSGNKVDKNKKYYFEVEQGPALEQYSDTSIMVNGDTLLALEGNNFENKNSLLEAKKLMRYIINYHLGGKPLKTHQIKWKYNV